MNKTLLGIVGAAALGMTSAANAGFMMALDLGDDGTIDALVSDNTVAGSATIAGVFGGAFTTHTDQTAFGDVISVDLSIGAFTFTSLSSQTGNATFAPVEMSTAFTVTSTGAGTLAVYVSDDSFTGGGGYDFSLSTTSVADGSLSGQGFTGTDLFDQSVDMTSVLTLNGPNPGAQGADDFNNLVTAGSPYSLTQKLVFTHNNSGTTNGTAVFNVPEPSALALLGIGLIGMGVARRRMKK